MNIDKKVFDIEFFGQVGAKCLDSVALGRMVPCRNERDAALGSRMRHV